MLRSLLAARCTINSTVKLLKTAQTLKPPNKILVQASLWRRCYTNLPNSEETLQNISETKESVPSTTAEAEKKRKIIELEMEVMRQEGRKVPTPSKIREDHWQHLLELGSRNQRRHYYLYLWNIEMSKESQLVKKELKKLEIAKRKEELDQANIENNHIIYGLFHNSMFLRIYDTTMDHFNNNKLIQSMQFGQNLVIDCSYDEYMNEKEMRNTAKQLMLCFALNRSHNEPFNVHHCNANYNTSTMMSLQKHLVQIHEPSFPFNITERSYLDLFPKEKLVYLTPHCKNDLEEFNPDDIYIVGAMVDKSSQEAVSLGKAKREGLRMARLPLDKHFQFKSGKSLTLDQMLQILLELKVSNNFEKAFEYVPKRKIVPFDQEQFDMQRRLKERKQMGKFKFNNNNNFEKKFGNVSKRKFAPFDEEQFDMQERHKERKQTGKFKFSMGTSSDRSFKKR